MKIVEITVGELQDGEVVLHPVYRKDGLLLTSRYKIVSSSVRQHILAHCDKHLPILVLEDAKDLTEFLVSKGYQDSKYLKMLKKIADSHLKIFPYIGLDFNNYLDERVVVEDLQQTIAPSDSPKVTDNEATTALSAKIIQTRSLYNHPLWVSMDRAFDSPLIQKRLKKAKTDIIYALIHDDVLMELYLSLKNYHDVLWTRGINTLIISLMLGVAIELSESELVLLAIAALMADIGFTKIPIEDFRNYLNFNMLSKEIKSHVAHSLELIKPSETCRHQQIVHGIIDHHEQYNGEGYPRAKQGNDISLFGRIIAIAQDYDTLVGGYAQERTVSVFEAQMQIWKNKRNKWDPDILRSFWYRNNYYKVGQKVQLQDGQKGTIIGFTDFAMEPLRPVIRLENGVIFDTFHQPVGFDIHTILQ